MKKSKLIATAFVGVLSAGALAGCGKKKADVLMWTGFGSSYSVALEDVLGSFTNETGISVEHESQSGYDNLQNNMNNSIATESYPNIANGYPDHFAGYISNEIQVPLDDYIKEYNEKHDTDLLSDFYPEYMVENQTLGYDEDGNALTYGLPFNKSTEVLGYNNFFVQYAQSLHSELKVPETWAEIEAQGPKYREVMQSLASYKDGEGKTVLGKWLYGTFDNDSEEAKKLPKNTLVDPASFETVDAIAEKDPKDYAPAGKEFLLDCSKVDMSLFRVISWDSADNMFITIVRQWGGEYTSYTKDDIVYGHGWARFYDDDIKARTVEALNYFKDMYDDKTFGLPEDMSSTASYSSDSFLSNQCVFTVCSSGGLSYNIKEGYGRRFRVAPIPYKDADHKFVISQGTNLAVFEQGKEATKKKAFETIVALCTGELQSEWAVQTGYYPASKSAVVEGSPYYKLIHEDQDTEVALAYQESAIVNEENYMDEAKKWTKFVDPGFVGSSIIRNEVKTVPGIVFLGEKSIESILEESYARLKVYHK